MDGSVLLQNLTFCCQNSVCQEGCLKQRVVHKCNQFNYLGEVVSLNFKMYGLSLLVFGPFVKGNHFCDFTVTKLVRKRSTYKGMNLLLKEQILLLRDDIH